jgi:double-stranded uracil-DNA glycosylase
MHTAKSFNPITNPFAKILILGSMPGVKSLEANQYYAHPRNAFWPIMEAIFGTNAASPYAHRIMALKAANVALWDVLQQCERTGSLDSAIKPSSRIPNDFELFFQQHPHIKLVGFNGAEAEKSFNRYVLHKLNLPNMQFVRLPSTSPAYTMSLANKVEIWRDLLQTS